MSALGEGQLGPLKRGQVMGLSHLPNACQTQIAHGSESGLLWFSVMMSGDPTKNVHLGTEWRGWGWR